MGPAGLDRAFETLGKIANSKVAEGCLAARCTRQAAGVVSKRLNESSMEPAVSRSDIGWKRENSAYSAENRGTFSWNFNFVANSGLSKLSSRQVSRCKRR